MREKVKGINFLEISEAAVPWIKFRGSNNPRINDFAKGPIVMENTMGIHRGSE
jgi:hypothetical protein